MAVTVDVASSASINNGAGAASPLTGTGPTVSATGVTAILIITIIQGATNVSTVKWGSQTLTNLGSIANANINPSAVLGFWGGVTPTTGAQTVTVTFTGTQIVDACVISYKGSETSSVAAAFPNLTTGTDPGTAQAPPWSLAVTSAVNHLTEAVWINGNGSNTIGGGQTSDINNIFVSNNGLILQASNKAGAAGTVTQTASNVTSTWSGIIVDIATPAAAGATFSQDDWPNPYRTTWYQHWQSRFEPTPTVLPVNLRVQRDWPNPTGFVYTDWYKFTDDTNTILPIPTVLTTTLRTQVTAPNPQPITWYRSWEQTSIRSVPTPFSQLNWPLPQPVTWYQSWIDTGNNLPLPTPFLPQDQSLSPRSYPRLSDYSWYEPGNVLLPFPTPFQPVDMPAPPRITWYQNWSQSLNLFYQSETFPFSQKDWPNSQRIMWDRFWSQNLLETTLFQVLTPFVQSDWPLPRTYPPIDQFYTQSNLNSTLNLVLMPFLSEWFLIPGTPGIDQTWIQNLLETTLASTGTPFVQSDYPNPYPVRWYVDHNQNLVINLPVGIKPTNQSDWPLTKAPQPIDQFYSQSLALNLPTPPPPLVIFSSGRQLTERDVLRSWMSAIGDKGRAIRYSQIPNFPG